MENLLGPALVTGGASGLGLGVVRKLSESGVPVAVLDRQPGPTIDWVH